MKEEYKMEIIEKIGESTLIEMMGDKINPEEGPLPSGSIPLSASIS
jgi:hypothetical protein